MQDGFWSACRDDVLPQPEICGDVIDSDCNGLGGPFLYGDLAGDLPSLQSLTVDRARPPM